MFTDAIVLTSCGAVSYVWLCASGAPFANALRSVMRHLAERAAWTAVALAAGGAVLWAAVMASLLILTMMLVPRAALAVAASNLVWSAAWIGAAAWAGQWLIVGRPPRFGTTFETSTALGIVAFVRDDPSMLSRVERLYRAHAIADDRVPVGSRAVAA
jgi:hypothetical protein